MKNVIATALLAAFVLLLVVLEVRIVHPSAGLVQLLWDADEAYLFIEEAVYGWRMTYLQFGASFGMVLLGHDPPAHAYKITYTIVRITANSEEVHVLRMAPSKSLYPLGHSVYAMIDGSPMRWSGSRFESAEYDEWGQIQASGIGSVDYSNVNGWSNRSDVIHRGVGETRYWIRLAGEAVDVIAVNGFRDNIYALDVQRNGSPRRRIWSVDSNIKRVGRLEYDDAFR